MQKQKARFLSEIQTGETVTVKAIAGGKNLSHRLNTMGIIAGTKIKLIRRSGGPFIIEARGSRVALGKGMVSKIEVE